MSNETRKPLAFVDTPDSVPWRMDSNRQDEESSAAPRSGERNQNHLTE
jgi:hypothetical protein